MSAVLEYSKAVPCSEVVGNRFVLPNISITYMYRDASNYKLYADVIFANPRRLSVDQLWAEVRGALGGAIHFFGEPMFRPECLGLPAVFLYSLPCYLRNDDDHDWHELCSIEETGDPVSQASMQTIDEFLYALRDAHASIG